MAQTSYKEVITCSVDMFPEGGEIELAEHSKISATHVMLHEEIRVCTIKLPWLLSAKSVSLIAFAYLVKNWLLNIYHMSCQVLNDGKHTRINKICIVEDLIT